MFRSTRLNVVAVFAVSLLVAAYGVEGSPYLTHGMKRIATRVHPRDNPTDIMAILDSFFNQKRQPWEFDSDVEMLPTGDERDTESVEVDGGATAVGDIDETYDAIPIPVPRTFTDFFGDMNPWYEGPNVCIEKKEVNEDEISNNDTSLADEKRFNDRVHYRFSNCENTGSTYVCVTRIGTNGFRKMFLKKYRCCRGFRRVPGKIGCSKVQVKPMIETLQDLGAKDFAELAQTAGLTEKLSVENLTIFAPTDEAIQDFSDSLQAANQVEFYIPPGRSRRDTSNSEGEVTSNDKMKQFVLRHIVPGFHDVDDLVTDQVLFSADRNLSLRYNVLHEIRQSQYPELGNRVMAINCAQIISINNWAENGYVHVVDRVIRPATQTVGQLIAEDAQFSKFRQLLEKAELLELLNKPGQLTLFAPTNAAFDKLDSALYNWLLTSSSKTCLKNVLRYHVLNYVVCSCIVKSPGQFKTSLENALEFNRSKDGKFLVGSGTQVVVPDVLGTNGVIHVIEEVLVPSLGIPTTAVLQQQNLTKFVSLLKETGLEDVINAADNLTLFAPTNDALNQPEAISAIEAARKNPEDLRNLLLFHTTKDKLHSCDMTNNKVIPSGFEGHSLRINVRPISFISVRAEQSTVQCVRVMNYDEHSCGGFIHQVEELLVPPKLTALQVLEANGNFSTFLRLLQESHLLSELKANSSFTLLAPSNDAFARLTEMQMEEISSDKNILTKVLRRHILPEVYCCAGMRAIIWPFLSYLQSLAGPLNIRHDYEGRIHVGDAKITSCDHVGTDGVVHFVNKVMLPMELKYIKAVGRGAKNPNTEILLFGL